MPEDSSPILSVTNLKTHFFIESGIACAVDGVSFDIPAGKTLAIVGESGCGKSVTALSIMRLVPDPPGKIVEGTIHFEGRNIMELDGPAMREIRGNDISMIFQEPMTSLNPVFTVGDQIGSILRLHRKLDKKQARSAAVDLLNQVGIPSPEDRVEDYPHQLSGGMRQRVMIAMALACDPKLLIADEPTTALDVTIQAQILDLLRKLQQERGMALLLITHDLGVVAEMADEVAIMYAGKIIERAPVKELFDKKSHPYAQGLFDSLPHAENIGGRLNTIAGQVPAATHFPDGCRFHPRCPKAMRICAQREPKAITLSPDHTVSCWLHDEATLKDSEQSAPLNGSTVA
ncbi:MAG: peptide ABC transporter ATP-binding protein [Candidatus Hydrogenedentota bacterium]|nr:MAG: peptide ABC transporter ATP-binding protein [Candidatus Hydrogenedentota bacterium]